MLESPDKKFRDLLIDPNEQILNILGTNMAQSFISTGTLGNGFAILTNERVYFKGKCYVRSGKKFDRKVEERVVDLKDITGTGFVHKRNVLFHFAGKYAVKIGLIITALMFVVGAIGGGVPMAGAAWPMVLLVIIMDKVLNRSIFEISYAGGGIGFDLRWISQENAAAFQKALVQAKDIKKKQSAGKTSEEKDVPYLQADELLKWKALLDQGIITQEDFAAKKKQLLNL